MKQITVILILYILFFSCLVNAGEEILKFKSDFYDWDIIDLKIRNDSVLYDIVYKELPDLDLELDVYYPFFSAEKSYPVIIFIHGGGFIIGEKSEINRFNIILDSFLNEGWVVISINYRLINKNSLFPENLKDVHDAVDWVYNNADKYEFDTEKIGLWGSSAGGNLALMTALTYNKALSNTNFNLNNYNTGTNADTKIENNTNNRLIDFVISFAGPTDLKNANLTLQKRITGFILGKEISESLLKKASPLYYINSNMPATLIVHGKNDIIVPYDQSKELYDKMQEMNIEAKLISLNSGHTISPAFLSGLKNKKDEILEFIKEHF